MKSLKTKGLSAAFALAFAASAFAAAPTPVAVWDGDFSAVQTGYTLNLNGNTLGDGNSSVTIDQAVGVTVTSDSTFASGFTVLVEYSGLDTSLHDKQVLATSTLTDAANRTGATIDTAGKSCGIWAGASWNSSGTYNSMTSSQSSGILVFSHYSTTSYSGTGTQLYYIAPDTLAGTTILNAGTLGSDNDKSKYKGFSIGGSSAAIDGFSAATGMKISKIAVFSGVPGLKSIQAYCAGTKNLQVSADKTFSEILDDAGITSTLAPYTSLEITAVNTPTITFDVAGEELYALTVNGSAVFDMDSSLYENGSFSKKLLTVGDSISAPDATYNVNADWKGAFVQSSDSITLYAQNAETISINIGGGGNNTTTVQPSPNDNLVSGSDYAGLYPTPGTAWNNISGHWTGGAQTVTLTGAKAFDGETTIVRNTVSLSGTANNTWTVGTSYESFLRGYLDDSGSVAVQIVGIPYSAYDVIIYATSDSSLALNYFTVNGVNYTCGSDGVAVEGTVAWGVGQTTTAALGKNAMLVKNVTGSTLSVTGTRAANSGPRVTVCAVQIVNKGTVEASDWTANLTASTDFDGGNGSGLSDQSGTWTDNALATMIITNTAASATLTFDGDLTAGTFKAVGGEGKCLVLDKGGNANLDITVYDLTETEEETVFNFNPGFDKVSSGGNYVGVGYAYSGNIASPLHFREAGNALTLTTVSGGKVDIGGSGTLSGTLELLADAEVRISGTYTSQNEQTSLRATKGVLTIAEGADVSVPYVQLVNSATSQACTLNIGGRLAVTSTSTSSDVYSERSNFKGILLGHYYGSCAVNVLQGGSLIGENAWLQMTYTAPTVLTINGGSVKVRGINAAVKTDRASDIVLTGGGTLEIAEGFVNTATYTNKFGYGTVKTYSYGGSDGWTHPGAVAFTDSVNGTVIDPCGMTNVFSGALSGAGKINIVDSVGGGSVSFTGASNNITGDIVVGANTTLNLGATRPTGALTVGGTMTLVLASKIEVPVFKVSSEPATGSVVLYDIDGTTVLQSTVDYDADAGTITVKPPVNTWNVAADLSFDTEANWSAGLPVSGQNAAIKVTDDAALTVAGTYEIDSLTISGAGEVTFTGEGSVTAANIYLENGATLKRDGATISATTGISLASGTVLKLDGVTENAAISGAGAVETYGNVNMAGLNTATGGITAKTGTLSTTAYSTDPWCSGFGPYSSGWNCNQIKTITVEDGACVDLNNTINTNDGIGYKLVIAGKGVLSDGVYSGAVKYTGASAVGASLRQLSNIELTGDALIDLGAGWGLVHSGYGAAALALNNHTLTVRGTAKQNFPMQNVTASSAGKIVLDGANLLLGNRYSNLTGVDVVINGGAKLQLDSKPTAIASVVALPSATASSEIAGYANMTNVVPVVKTVNIDSSALSVGDTITLMTADTALTEGENVTIVAGSRYTTTVGEQSVTATVNALAPFLHYDFNGEATLAGAKASDSVYEIPSYGNYWPSKIVAKNGYAALIDSGHVPWWNENSANVSPLHAGEMSVLALIRPKTIDSTVRTVWNLGSALENGIALVVKDSSTLALVGWTDGGSGFDIAVVSGIEKLEGKWHFVAIVTSENGTLLYVDDMVAFSETVVPQGIAQKGQFGSVHSNGNSKGYYGQNDAGFLLDDWRVYDAALTDVEVKELRKALNPPPFTLHLR